MPGRQFELGRQSLRSDRSQSCVNRYFGHRSKRKVTTAGKQYHCAFPPAANRPVDPKPSLARAVEFNSLASKRETLVTGATTSCAIRAPLTTSKGTPP